MMIAGNEWWMFFIWFVPQIFLHELGHYVGFRMFNIKPKISFKWWGIQIGEQKDLFKLKPFEFGFVTWIGVISGFVYTILFGQMYVLIYLIMCGVDLMNMYYVIKAKRYDGSMGEYLIELYFNELKTLREAKSGR